MGSSGPSPALASTRAAHKWASASLCARRLDAPGSSTTTDAWFSRGIPLLLPVHDGGTLYGCLVGRTSIWRSGCSRGAHVTRLHRDQPGPSGPLVGGGGHRWWLPEGMGSQSLVEISLWKNQDQNENQALHEVEILQNIMATCNEPRAARSTVSIGDLVSAPPPPTPARID